MEILNYFLNGIDLYYFTRAWVPETESWTTAFPVILRRRLLQQELVPCFKHKPTADVD